MSSRIISSISERTELGFCKRPLLQGDSAAVIFTVIISALEISINFA